MALARHNSRHRRAEFDPIKVVRQVGPGSLQLNGSAVTIPGRIYMSKAHATRPNQSLSTLRGNVTGGRAASDSVMFRASRFAVAELGSLRHHASATSPRAPTGRPDYSPGQSESASDALGKRCQNFSFLSPPARLERAGGEKKKENTGGGNHNPGLRSPIRSDLGWYVSLRRSLRIAL